LPKGKTQNFRKKIGTDKEFCMLIKKHLKKTLFPSNT